MAQHGFNQLGGGHNGGGAGGGSINPNDLNMSGAYGSSFQNNNYNSSNTPSNAYSGGGALFGDDELLEGLASPTEPQQGMYGSGGQEFGGMNEMSMGGYSQAIHTPHHHGLPMDQSHINGFSNTPEGDPIQSPFAHNFTQYRQNFHPQSFGTSLQSPISYAGSPLAGSDLNNDGSDPNYLNAKVRPRMSTSAIARKSSSSRTPLTPKASSAMANLTIGSADSFGGQPIRTNGAHNDKPGQWIQTPNSMGSFPGSGFSSPMQQGLHSAQINDILLKGGTSMPAKLGTPLTTSQEAKRKRRRESHNLVERRRRDNINERIQDLSKLVPAHRLEDEKIKKLIQNGTPLSPTLSGIPSPSQATSGLAGPGARRAAGGTAGNITTGLPVEDKDKGPNKGDILNGAVSWTRDLMWMLNLKLRQIDELHDTIMDLGGQIPYEQTDDEQRMRSELEDAIRRLQGDELTMTYTRCAGTGLRVPNYTDYKGEPLNGMGTRTGPGAAAAAAGVGASLGVGASVLGGASSVSPDGGTGVDHGGQNHPNDLSALGGELIDPSHYWNDEEDGELEFKEEDEYMDLN